MLVSARNHNTGRGTMYVTVNIVTWHVQLIHKDSSNEILSAVSTCLLYNSIVRGKQVLRHILIANVNHVTVVRHNP